MKLSSRPFVGVLAFLIVLFTMPLGHAAMIVMEKLFGSGFLYWSAVIVGIVGVVLVLVGLFVKGKTGQTFLGLFGGLFIWTGWVEFAFVYYAHRYHVPPLIENGEVVTKPEYLIMPATIGLLAIIMLAYLFNTYTNCNFFRWFQRQLGIKRESDLVPRKRLSVITATEMAMVLWANYILLLIAYDERFFGDRSWFTYLVAFGCLLWSLYLFLQLLRIEKWDYALRYAIPTVVIFWNFVEILGRWNLFKEIWIEPFRYWKEILLMLLVFVLLILITVWEERHKERTRVA